MYFLNLFSKAVIVVPKPREPGRKELAAISIERTMYAFSIRQDLLALSNRSMRPRHIKGLTGYRVSAKSGRVALSMVQGAKGEQDPWWRHDEVEKYDIPSANDNINASPELLDEAKRRMLLLDGREVTSIRQVFYDHSIKKRFKRFWAEFKDGTQLPFSSIPTNLIPLYGIDTTGIPPDSIAILVEGASAADALKLHAYQAFGTSTGALATPSERALEPLLVAKSIVLWPDNDSAGVHHMQNVAKRLRGMGAKNIKIVRWLGGPRKGDAADIKGGKDEIDQLLRAAKTWDEDSAISNDYIVKLRTFGFVSQLRLPQRVAPPSPKLVVTEKQRSTVSEKLSQLDTSSWSDDERAAVAKLLTQLANQ
ncbi:MAG: hypothetical protein ACI9WC_002179 [Arenicella sp.]|jgi:hypothetical protein